MLKSSWLLAAAFFCAAFIPFVSADEPIRIEGNKQDWWIRRGVFIKNENGITRMALPCWMELKPAKRIKIEPGKRYTLSCEFRFTGEGKTEQPLQLGYTGFLNNGTRISHANVLRMFKNFATLAEDAPKGSASITVNGNIKPWADRIARVRGVLHSVAFGAEAGDSDLPNFRLSQLKNNGITQLANGSWKIELRSPLAFDAAKGEKVALHFIGASYMNVQRGVQIGNEWVKYSGTYSLKKQPGVVPFYVGTEAVGIGFFCHHKGGAIEFRNIVIEAAE